MSPTASAACSDTAEQYPMLIGSGYEGEPCDSAPAGTALDLAARSASRDALGAVALATMSPTWHETVLHGSDYERHAAATAISSHGRD